MSPILVTQPTATRSTNHTYTHEGTPIQLRPTNATLQVLSITQKRGSGCHHMCRPKAEIQHLPHLVVIPREKKSMTITYKVITYMSEGRLRPIKRPVDAATSRLNLCMPETYQEEHQMEGQKTPYKPNLHEELFCTRHNERGKTHGANGTRISKASSRTNLRVQKTAPVTDQGGRGTNVNEAHQEL